MKAGRVALTILFLAACDSGQRADRPLQRGNEANARAAVGFATPDSSQALVVLHLIEAIGRDSFVARYMHRDAPDSLFCMDPISDGVATGDSLWLVVSQRLEGGTDGCATEGLDQATSLALARAPSRVFRMFPTLGIESLCSMPFYEGTPDSVVRDHYRRLNVALAAMRDSDLVDKRDSCRRYAERSFKQILPGG